MKRKIEVASDSNYSDKYAKNNNEIAVAKFCFFNFFKFSNDTYICDKARSGVVSPKITGSRLIADYYGIKYGCNIEFALKPAFFPETESYSLAKFFLTPTFTDIRNTPGHYRKAFLWGMDSTHAIPVIYIKEGDQEGILIANSLGTTPNTKKMANDIKINTKIDVYTVLNPRQADDYSCYTDALVFARDTTAFCVDKTDYYIPGLLAFICKSSQKEGDFFVSKLPDELLKTCQLSSFLNYHQEKQHRIIHNKETLDNFRARYTDRDVNTSFGENNEPVTQDLYSYPRKKGLKFIAIMTTQFYLNQVNSALDNTLSLEQQLDFIDRAKKTIIQHFDSQKREEQLMQLTRSFIQEQNSSLHSSAMSI